MHQKPQLYLLHFAGGSSYSFEFLKKHFSHNFEFLPLELPGRGIRNREPLLFDKKAAIEDYFKQIKAKRNTAPYLVYGHSMGATLGLSIVQQLELINDPPLFLYVSGNPGPGASKENNDPEKPKRYLMSDADFKEELRMLGGIPEEIFTDTELYNFFSPILRADFELLEKDEYSEEGMKIMTPIYAVMGDEEESRDQISHWKKFTEGHFDYNILPGNHFFIHHHPKELAQLIIDRLQTYSLTP